MAGVTGPTGKKPSPGVDLTPILDILVSIIFFLLLFTAYSELSQVSLPPVQSGPNSENELPVDRLPRLTLSVSRGLVTISFKWFDERPGELRKEIAVASMTSRENWINEVRALLKPYADTHPDGRTIQIGLDRGFNYQHLILTIDAASSFFPDIALVDPDEVSKNPAGGS